MNRNFWLLIPFALALSWLSCCSQSKVITAKEKKEVIDTCITAFETYYIYPDRVREMKHKVCEHYEEGYFDRCQTLEQLTDEIKRDFRSVSNDRHIWIDILENLPVKDADVSDEEKIDELRKINFGFSEFKMIDKHIAFLQLDAFVDYRYGRDTAAAFMKRLSQGDAIIIDLRENHGGNKNMVRYIASHFFDDTVQLNSLYFRFADSLVTNYTDPSLAESKMTRQKLYILTSGNTASAAESFAYAMKNYKRAVLVGGITRGAAHWVETFTYPGLGIFLEIPVARPLNPVTNTNWEGTGVMPDIEVDPDKALNEVLIMERERFIKQ